MLIAQISDSHIEIPEPDGAGRIADFEKVIGNINLLPVQPDMVIHTGDLTHCDKKIEYRFCKSFFERLHVPYHVIPGNKDSRDHLTTVLGGEGGFVQYTIEAGNWLLVMLDTISDTSNKGAYCEKRLKWLDETVSATDKHVALFAHHPTWELEGSKYPFQFESKELADAFDEAIAKHAQIKALFCGHAHRNTQTTIAHIQAMTLTAMSLDRRKGNYPDEMAGKPVYQLIDLKDDGTFERKFQICD